MTFGQKLKNARIAKGLTQKQLGLLIDAKHNSISNWENDQNRPGPDLIELLCGALDITPNQLLQSDRSNYTFDESMLIEKYRTLDEHGMKVVNIILNEEWERIVEGTEKQKRGFASTPVMQDPQLIFEMEKASIETDVLKKTLLEISSFDKTGNE